MNAEPCRPSPWSRLAGPFVALLACGCFEAEPSTPNEEESTPIFVLPPPRVEEHEEPIDHRPVLEGLRWLARHQHFDGSWGARSMRSSCDPSIRCWNAALEATDHYDEGLTGLAVLCFLGAGYTPESREIVESTTMGDVVGAGLEWLRKHQETDGSFGRYRPFMYNQALATLAMTEAYRLTRNDSWREPAQKGLEFLQRAQRPNPSGRGLWGWRYASRTEIEADRKGRDDAAYRKELHDSDTSVTTWCAKALRAGVDAGLDVEQESLDGAMAFCEFVTARDGLVGYLDAASAGAHVTGPFDDAFDYHVTTMSAGSMAIRILVRGDLEDANLRFSAERLAGDLPRVGPDHRSLDYYYWLLGTLALRPFDGPGAPSRSGRFWAPWEKALREAILPLQDRRSDACSKGGWLVSDRWSSYCGAGPVYNTAMSLLTLETLEQR